MLRRLIAGALVALVSFGPALAGPSCTLKYPQGYTKPTLREWKKPTCNMDVDGIVWGFCTRRVKI
jgi:hypothetical protein